MTIIRCTKSPAVNPYVVLATQMVKGCPIHGTLPLETCRTCTYCKMVDTR